MFLKESSKCIESFTYAFQALKLTDDVSKDELVALRDLIGPLWIQDDLGLGLLEPGLVHGSEILNKVQRIAIDVKSSMLPGNGIEVQSNVALFVPANNVDS